MDDTQLEIDDITLVALSPQTEHVPLMLPVPGPVEPEAIRPPRIVLPGFIPQLFGRPPQSEAIRSLFIDPFYLAQA